METATSRFAITAIATGPVTENSVRDYLVECFIPGITRTDVVAAAARARLAASELSASGTVVEYVAALLMSADEVVFHMFRSDGADAVREASRRAELGFERVVESLVIVPAGSESRSAAATG